MLYASYEYLLERDSNAGYASAVIAISPSYDLPFFRLHNESNTCTIDIFEALLQLSPDEHHK